MRCKTCKVKFEVKYFNQKYCSKECFSPDLKLKPIRKVSKKQTILNAKYSVLRIEFLGKKENRVCPITGTPTTDIHHKMGRKGFADDLARQNNIPLIIDIRFFLAVSREGHNKIENNPDWAKENGYSLNRI